MSKHDDDVIASMDPTRDPPKADAAPLPIVPSRARVRYVGLAVASIGVGMAIRHIGKHLPRFVFIYVPDGVWAMMVYWLMRCISPRSAPWKTALSAAAFAIGVEFFKLCDPPGVHAFRNTILGGLILGHVYTPVKIVAYLTGIAFALLIDGRLVARVKAKRC